MIDHGHLWRANLHIIGLKFYMLDKHNIKDIGPTTKGNTSQYKYYFNMVVKLEIINKTTNFCKKLKNEINIFF